MTPRVTLDFLLFIVRVACSQNIAGQILINIIFWIDRFNIEIKLNINRFRLNLHILC